MAQLDLSAVVMPGVIRRETLSATPGNVRRVLLPTALVGVRPGRPMTLSVQAITTDAKLVTADSVLADEAAIGAAGYVTLTAGVVYEVQIPDGSPAYRILASATASQVVEIEVNVGAQ
jgi:hypothetical protein